MQNRETAIMELEKTKELLMEKIPVVDAWESIKAISEIIRWMEQMTVQAEITI